MAKISNLLPTEEVTLSLNVQSVWYLDRLIETGLYGNTRAQAATKGRRGAREIYRRSSTRTFYKQRLSAREICAIPLARS